MATAPKKVHAQIKDGKALVKLLGDTYDVTDKLVDGVAMLHIYGLDFEIHAKTPKAKKEPKQKAKPEEPVVDDKTFIETPVK